MQAGSHCKGGEGFADADRARLTMACSTVETFAAAHEGKEVSANDAFAASMGRRKRGAIPCFCRVL